MAGSEGWAAEAGRFLEWAAAVLPGEYGNDLQQRTAKIVSQAVARELADAGTESADDITLDRADVVLDVIASGELQIRVRAASATRIAREFLVWLRSPLLLELALTLPPTQRRLAPAHPPSADEATSGVATSGRDGPRQGALDFAYWYAYAFDHPDRGDPRLLTPDHAEAYSGVPGADPITTAQVLARYLASRVPELAPLRRSVRAWLHARPDESEWMQLKLTWLDTILLRWLANNRVRPEAMTSEDLANLRTHIQEVGLNPSALAALDRIAYELFAAAQAMGGGELRMAPPPTGWETRARRLFQAIAGPPAEERGNRLRLLAVLAGPSPDLGATHTARGLANALGMSEERVRESLVGLEEWVEATEFQARRYLLTRSPRRLVSALEALAAPGHSGVRAAATLLVEQLLPILRSPPAQSTHVVGPPKLAPVVRFLMAIPDEMGELNATPEPAVTSATIRNWGRELIERGVAISREGWRGVPYRLLPGLGMAAATLARGEVSGDRAPGYDDRPLTALLHLPPSLDNALDSDPYSVILGDPITAAVWRDAGHIDGGGLTPTGEQLVAGLRSAATAIAERRALSLAAEIAAVLATPGMIEALSALLPEPPAVAFPRRSLEELQGLPGWSEAAQVALNGGAGRRLIAVSSGICSLASVAAQELIMAIREGVDPPGLPRPSIIGAAASSDVDSGVGLDFG